MEHPEYVTYVVIVYAVTFGLLAAYLLWLWRNWKAEKEWAAQHLSRTATEATPHTERREPLA